jgi:hypothetical protein
VAGQMYVLLTTVAIFFLNKKAQEPIIMRTMTAEEILKGGKVMHQSATLVFQEQQDRKPFFDFVQNIPKPTQIQF